MRPEAEPVACRRLCRPLPVAEHLCCPYCWGEPEAVASGVHERFCDFRVGDDPIAFGFPESFGRYRSR